MRGVCFVPKVSEGGGSVFLGYCCWFGVDAVGIMGLATVLLTIYR